MKARPATGVPFLPAARFRHSFRGSLLSYLTSKEYLDHRVGARSRWHQEKHILGPAGVYELGPIAGERLARIVVDRLWHTLRVGICVRVGRSGAMGSVMPITPIQPVLKTPDPVYSGSGPKSSSACFNNSSQFAGSFISACPR